MKWPGKCARTIAAGAKATSIRHVAAVSFAVVATVAAAISYSHVRQVAGESWQASLLPLSIDGLLVAGSLALWLERRDGGKGSPLSWISVALGLLASLGANLASSKPLWFPREWVDPAVAVWPAIALALSFELLVRVARSSNASPSTRKTAADPEPVPAAQTVGELAAERVSEPVDLAAELPPAAAPDPAPAAEDATPPQEQFHEWTFEAATEWALSELRAGNGPVGWKKVRTQTGLTEGPAGRAARAAKATHEREARPRLVTG